MLEFKTMARSELGIYTNPFVPEIIKKRAVDISQLAPGFASIIHPFRRKEPFPNRVIVAGGEGSIRTILQIMHDREEIRPVGLLPGGSQNVLYNALFELDLKSDVKAFLEKGLDEYPEDQRLRLGMINDRVFINHVGLGRFEQYLGEFNNRLRFLPNGRRTLVAALFSLTFATLDPNSRREILNLYTIVPVIGQVPAFPDQRLLSDTLTHARIERAGSLIRTLFYWQRGKPAPNGAITQYQYSRFADIATGNSIWLDGDTIPYMLQDMPQGALIKRTPYGIPIVAMI